MLLMDWIGGIGNLEKITNTTSYTMQFREKAEKSNKD